MLNTEERKTSLPPRQQFAPCTRSGNTDIETLDYVRKRNVSAASRATCQVFRYVPESIPDPPRDLTSPSLIPPVTHPSKTGEGRAFGNSRALLVPPNAGFWVRSCREADSGARSPGLETQPPARQTCSVSLGQFPCLPSRGRHSTVQ